MSIPSHTQQIADAIYRGMMRYNVIRKMKKFVIIDEHNSRLGFFVIASSANGTFGFEVINSLNICKRYNAIQLVRCRLESVGYQPLVIYSIPTYFMKISMDSLDAPELNVHKEKEGEAEEAEEAKEEKQPITIPTSVEIRDHASFFRAIYLTPLQQQCVEEELPAGVPTTDLFVLSCFDADVLHDCGLNRVQIAAWEKRIGKLLA